jgi:hypothetical protein
VGLPAAVACHCSVEAVPLVTVSLLPSAAVVMVAWLKANPDLAAIHGGRVGTKLNATLPAIRVQRVGGVPAEPWRDAPVMQVECWAADEGAADLLARTVVAALPTLRGTYPSGQVWSYEVDSGPFWAPDDPSLSNNARYILTVRLLATS